MLIEILSDGAFHSGDELGESLGISRTAVWKQVGRLQDEGILVESLKGKGYRIPGGLDLLKEERIRHALLLSGSNVSYVQVFQSIDSTNQYLMDKDLQPEEVAVCFAEKQLAGRGRRGRVWESPFAKNVYMSVAFHLGGGVDKLAGLSLAVGVFITEFLHEVGITGAKLKWPNDILVDGRKLCGVLVELKGQPDTGWYVVIGVGLNVYMTEASSIEQPWTNMVSYLTNRDVERTQIASSLAVAILRGLEDFKLSGFSCLLERWKCFDALAGARVFVSGSEIEGIAKGVDETGALLVETSNGVIPVQAGEVSVRLCES